MNILEKASRLPAVDKLHLIDRLISQLDLPDPAVEASWAEAAAHRSKAIQEGNMSTRPLAEVLRKYER